MSLFDTDAAAVVQSIAARFADDAIYTPPMGSPADVRIVLGYQDQAVDLAGFATQVRSPGVRGEVAQTQLALPEKGATVAVLTGRHAGTTYTVTDFFADLERSQWTLDLS